MKLVMKLSFLLVGLMVTAVFMMSAASPQVVLAAFTPTPTSPPPATDTPVPTDTPAPIDTPVPAETAVPTATSPSDSGSPSGPTDPTAVPQEGQETAVPTPGTIPALGGGPGASQVSMIGMTLLGIFVLLAFAWWRAWQMYRKK